MRKLLCKLVDVEGGVISFLLLLLFYSFTDTTVSLSETAGMSTDVQHKKKETAQFNKTHYHVTFPNSSAQSLRRQSSSSFHNSAVCGKKENLKQSRFDLNGTMFEGPDCRVQRAKGATKEMGTRTFVPV